MLSDPEQRAADDAALAGEDASDQEALDDTVDVDPLAEWPWCVPFLEATPRLRHPRPGIVESVVVAAAGIMAGIGWHELLESLVVAPGFVGSWWVTSVPLVVAVTWLGAITGICAIMAGLVWLGWGLIGGAALWGQPWVVTAIATGWVAWVAGVVWWWHRRMAWPAGQIWASNMIDMPKGAPSASTGGARPTLRASARESRSHPLGWGTRRIGMRAGVVDHTGHARIH